jgi:hypothetical protein
MHPATRSRKAFESGNIVRVAEGGKLHKREGKTHLPGEL